MFCRYCGKEIGDYSENCGFCGKKVNIIRKWGLGSLITIIIGTLLVPLVGIILGIYGMNQEEKRRQGIIIFLIAIIMIFLNLLFILNK